MLTKQPAPLFAATDPDFQRALEALRASSNYDNSIQLDEAPKNRLRLRWIRPSEFTRFDLFEAMAAGEIRVFRDFPIDPRTRGPLGIKSHLLPAIRAGFPSRKRARVRSNGALRYQPIPQILDRWLAAKSTFGVTDLHYVGTRFDTLVDTSQLNAFNLLSRGAQGHQSQLPDVGRVEGSLQKPERHRRGRLWQDEVLTYELF